MKNTSIKIILILSLLGITTTLFAQTAEVKIKTSAICSTCKRAIERNLLFEKGIKKANLDLDDKVVTVVYDSSKTDAQKIRIAITQIGYDADSLVADSIAYSKLESCCKKDAEMH